MKRHSDRMILYPIIAAVLALMLWKDVRADVWGAMNGGETAFVLARNLPCKPACPNPLILEFTIKFTQERR